MHKLALITGASSGLGKALAEALAKQGISLILVARDKDLLNEVAQALPGSTRVHPCDLAQAEQKAELIKLIHELTPDLVINNAGFGLYGPILSHPLLPFQEMVAVNAQAVMELSIESARALKNKNQEGVILNVSSAAAFFSYPTFCVYAATKAFVNQFSQGFDEEMKPHGIRILTVCPGQIDTPFRRRAACGFPQKTARFTLQEATAVRLILKQIEKKKSFQIIDWRYRIGVVVGRWLPTAIINRILTSHLKDRYR